MAGWFDAVLRLLPIALQVVQIVEEVIPDKDKEKKPAMAEGMLTDIVAEAGVPLTSRDQAEIRTAVRFAADSMNRNVWKNPDMPSRFQRGELTPEKKPEKEADKKPKNKGI